MLLIYFLVGAVVGGVVHYLWSSRQSNTKLFINNEATQSLRVEALQAVQERIKKRQDRILAVAKEQGRITNDGVEELYCLSDQTASRYLSQLVEEGKLTRHGKGRGIYYTLPR